LSSFSRNFPVTWILELHRMALEHRAAAPPGAALRIRAPSCSAKNTSLQYPSAALRDSWPAVSAGVRAVARFGQLGTWHLGTPTPEQNPAKLAIARPYTRAGDGPRRRRRRYDPRIRAGSVRMGVYGRGGGVRRCQRAARRHLGVFPAPQGESSQMCRLLRMRRARPRATARGLGPSAGAESRSSVGGYRKEVLSALHEGARMSRRRRATKRAMCLQRVSLALTSATPAVRHQSARSRATARPPALTAGQESRSAEEGYCREVFFALHDGARIRSAAPGGAARGVSAPFWTTWTGWFGKDSVENIAFQTDKNPYRRSFGTPQTPPFGPSV
jgi:hypothetical protein